MKKIRILLPLMLTLLLMSLSGCADATPVPEETHTEEPEEAAPAPKVDTVVAEVEPDHCLDCHSDKDRLIETAGPVIEIDESESEGAG